MYGTLQENTHQHKCERKVESSMLHEESIRGFAERARALCDEKHLTDELQNIEDVFIANGYERNEVKQCLREKLKGKTEKNEEIQRSGQHSICEGIVRAV